VTNAPVAVPGGVGTDENEFMALLEPVLPAAYRLAFAVLGSPPAAEDAVQEAALKAWQNFGRFRRDAELKPWLLAIVINECRRQKRTRWSSVGELPETFEDPDPQQPQHAESVDLRRAVYRLPYDQRVAVILRYYVDLSFEEVGQSLGVSTKAAKSRTYRALERLRLSPEVLLDE
jgi:RNA polymerase sigma-70 factor (ECF subfamily)